MESGSSSRSTSTGASPATLLQLTAASFGLLFFAQYTTVQYIIGFLLGLLFGVILVIGGLVGGLTWAEKKVAAAKEQELRSKSQNVLPETTRDRGVHAESLIQLLPPSFIKRTDNWVWGALKENILLFSFRADEKKAADRIVLDNAEITVIKTKAGAVWRRSNFIRIIPATGTVLGKYRSCNLFLRTPREMEEWYFALTKATKLTSGVNNASTFHTRSYFAEVNSRLYASMSQPGPIDATWLNALSARVFYHLHREKGFVHAVQKKIQHKLDKIDKPSVITSLKVADIHFGPNFLMFKNVQLVSITPEGEVRIDADVDYNGGFQLEIEMVFDVEIMGRHFSTDARLAVACKHLKGKAHVRMGAVPSERIWLGFHTEPDIELDINSLIGQTNPVANIPKLASILIYKVKQELIEVMVLPDMEDIAIPDLPIPEGQEKPKRVHWEYIQGLVIPDKAKKDKKKGESPPLPSRPLLNPNSSPLPTTTPPALPARTSVSYTAVPNLDSAENTPPVLPARRRASAGTTSSESPLELRSLPKPPELDEDEDVSEMEMSSFKSMRKRSTSSGNSTATTPTATLVSKEAPSSEFSDWIPVVVSKEQESPDYAVSPRRPAPPQEDDSPALTDSDDRSLLTDSTANSIFNQSTGQTSNPFVESEVETSDPLSALAKLGSSPPKSSAWSAFGESSDDFFTPASKPKPIASSSLSTSPLVPAYVASPVTKIEAQDPLRSSSYASSPLKPSTPLAAAAATGSGSKASLTDRFSRKLEKYSNKVADLIVSATAPTPGVSVQGTTSPLSTSPPSTSAILSSSPSKSSTSVTDDIEKSLRTAKKELKAKFSSFFGDDSSSSSGGRELRSVPKGKSNSQEL